MYVRREGENGIERGMRWDETGLEETRLREGSVFWRGETKRVDAMCWAVTSTPRIKSRAATVAPMKACLLLV